MIGNCPVFMAVFKRTLCKVGKYHVSDLKGFAKEDLVKAAVNAINDQGQPGHVRVDCKTS